MDQRTQGLPLMKRTLPGIKTSCFVLCLMVTLLALQACGKKGAPNPPGPQNEITYPRLYPNPD